MKVLTGENQEIPQLKLDMKDKRILYMLTRNARFSYAKIADHVGLTRDAIKYRIQQYEKNGLIQGYRTLVNAKKLGYQSYHLFLDFHSSLEDEKQLIDFMKLEENINAILKFSGRLDYEIAIMAKNVDQFDNIMKRIINKTKVLQNCEMIILLKTIKSATLTEAFIDNVSIKEETGRNDSSFFKDFMKKKDDDLDVDETDFKVLRELANNARATLAEISKKTKLSPDAVAYRIKKMIRQNVIIEFRPVINYHALGYSIHAVLFKLQNISEENEKIFCEFIRQQPNVLWATNTLGKWNVLLYLLTKNQEEFHDTIIEIRKQFPDIIRSYDTLIAYQEYKYTYFPEGIKPLKK